MNTALSEGYQHIYLGQKLYFTPVNDLKGPILFLLCVFWADFKAISTVVSLVYMQSSGRFVVRQNNISKGRIALFDFQKNSLVVMNFTKNDKYPPFIV